MDDNLDVAFGFEGLLDSGIGFQLIIEGAAVCCWDVAFDFGGPAQDSGSYFGLYNEKQVQLCAAGIGLW